MESSESKELITVKALVTCPTAESIDVLAEAFFKTTGHGRLMEWKKFKENFAVQSRFFNAGVFAVLNKLCDMSGAKMDMSEIKKDIIKQEMEDIKKEIGGDKGLAIDNLGDRTDAPEL